jgi:hypothetical protein
MEVNSREICWRSTPFRAISVNGKSARATAIRAATGEGAPLPQTLVGIQEETTDTYRRRRSAVKPRPEPSAGDGNPLSTAGQCIWGPGRASSGRGWTPPNALVTRQDVARPPCRSFPS